MKKITLILFIFISFGVVAQEKVEKNLADRMIENTRQKFTIGGYGQVDFNKENGDNRTNSKLDVHRMILMMGYKFNEKTSFITEFEFEHVKEVYVEQAFLNYKFNTSLNLRAGLMLVPMGIINEYHESSTFNGVERPNVDKYIVPSTWREIGVGITGILPMQNLKYQFYIMNGFKSYDKTGILRGSDGLRKGRQKGAESFMSYPSISAKLDYFGIKGLKLGASFYNGKTQSNLYHDLNENDKQLVEVADSSVVGVTMVGLDAKYKIGALELKGQYTYASLSNTLEYNKFTGKDLGKSLLGYYVEAGYDLLSLCKKKVEDKLILFTRYEKYNTHNSVDKSIAKNDEYDRTDITFGLGWKPSKGSAFKVDYQLKSNASSDNKTIGQLNMGIAVWF